MVIPASVISSAKAQNVGIGTANPVQKLAVNGGIKVGKTDNAAGNHSQE